MTQSEEPVVDETPPAPLVVRSALPRIPFGKSKSGDYIYFLAVILASIASWTVALIPRFLPIKLAELIGWISATRKSSYRDNIRSNLVHVTKLPPQSEKIEGLVRSAFRTNALNVIDLLEIPHLSRSDFDKRVRLAKGSWSTLDDILESGDGAIIITAHLGPFDFVASYLRVRGYPLSALTARTTGHFAFHFVSFLRASQNMRVIETSSSGLRQALRSLQQGELIILLSDRDFFLSGRQAVFFGEETSLPVGAVRLARDTGVPIVPFFAYRQDNHYELVIGATLRVEKTEDRDADLDKGVRQMAEVLEEAIGHAPGQWVLFQRAWPAGEHPPDNN